MSTQDKKFVCLSCESGFDRKSKYECHLASENHLRIANLVNKNAILESDTISSIYKRLDEQDLQFNPFKI